MTNPNVALDNLQRLRGRRVVITGASSGIGQATAQLFMAEGADVILLDRNRSSLEATSSEGKCVSFEVDITNESALRVAVDSGVQKLGGIDGVINAAGIMITGPTIDVTPDVWRKVINVNLTGTFFVVQACLPWLKKSKGSTIVNIASGAGLLPNAPGLAAYAASKGGVISLTKALASDLAPDIRVNCACPGMVDTPMAKGNGGNVANYALKRMAEPIEIARALLFLTSVESSYITGAALAVDGGRTFH
jgi:NAD(P)-dependent dehydrogenase (short-subunit alcohol dehydrogenase family)